MVVVSISLCLANCTQHKAILLLRSGFCAFYDCVAFQCVGVEPQVLFFIRSPGREPHHIVATVNSAQPCISLKVNVASLCGCQGPFNINAGLPDSFHLFFIKAIPLQEAATGEGRIFY